MSQNMPVAVVTGASRGAGIGIARALGRDEAAALRDLDDRLRGVPQPNGSRMAERERRFRLAYLGGAEQRSRDALGRPQGSRVAPDEGADLGDRLARFRQRVPEIHLRQFHLHVEAVAVRPGESHGQHVGLAHEELGMPRRQVSVIIKTIGWCVLILAIIGLLDNLLGGLL